MSEQEEQRAERHEDVATTVVAAISFVVGILGAVAFAWAYAAGPDELFAYHTQALGVSLMVALAGLGTGLVVWAHGLMPQGPHVEEREFPAPRPLERREMLRTYWRDTEAIGRRSLLGRLLAAALGALSIAALFPLRSLGHKPFPVRVQTGWQPGVRLVDERGRPVAVDALAVHGVLTVFPEHYIHKEHTQTILIRLPDELAANLNTPRTSGTPNGHVAFSKVCTHAGCAVGLYQQEKARLFCPCHQTAFDVLDGAQPILGPATRPLPQLPLGVDDEGFLIAIDDYAVPVGPGFWTWPSVAREPQP